VPANGTISAVVVDDDCTSMVMTVPEAMPDTGPRPTLACMMSLARPTITLRSTLPIAWTAKRISPIPMMISPTPDHALLGSQDTLASSSSLAGVSMVFMKFMLFMSTPALSCTSRPASACDVRSSG